MSLINSVSNIGRRLRALHGGSEGVAEELQYTPSTTEESAMREIYEEFGDVVEIGPETIKKFGENKLVGTAQATLMTLPAGVLSETYLTDNLITHISSSDTGDTGLVDVHGYTIDGSGNFTHGHQQATLNGQNKVALTTPLARSQRFKNLSADDWLGDIYAFEDDTLTLGVPNTDAKIHLIGPAEDNQSLKAAYTVPSSEYLLISLVYGSINSKTAANAVIRLRVRNKGGVFRTLLKRGVHSTGVDLHHDVEQFMIIPPNSDIELTADAGASNTEIAGGFNARIARIKANA